MSVNLLIDEPPLQVLPSLAVVIGLNEAIIIQQIHYWIKNQKVVGRMHGGEKWIYNTYEEWQEQFPFWSVNTIQRIFASLQKSGLLISAQLDKTKHDMTKFYRIDYTKLREMQDTNLVCSDDTNLVSSNTPNWNDVNKNNIDYTETTTENAKTAPAIQPPIGQTPNPEPSPDPPSKKNGNGHSKGRVRGGGKKVDLAAPVPGFEVFKHEIRPLAETFVSEAGQAYYPTNGEIKLWYKVMLDWNTRGFGPDDVRAAIAKLRSDRLTIGGPQSLTKTLKSLAADRVYQADQTPIYHRQE